MDGTHPRAGLRRRASSALAVAALLLAGCTTAPPPGPTPTASPSIRTDFAGRFPVAGGRRIYLECHGTGSPTVLLIGGLRSAADYWNTGYPNRIDKNGPGVAESVAGFTRVCSYDRPGTVRGGNAFSRSDPIPQPSSETSAVADLHALMAAAGISGPYVLAGHSYGGLIARLYASTYPEEVVGIVLIDALSEGFDAAMTPEQNAQWQKSQEVPAADVAEYPGIERLDLPAVMAEIRSAPPIHPMPLVVLSADKSIAAVWQSMIDSGQLPPGTPPDLGVVIDRAQKASQNYQAHLLPGAIHITETHSGHDIPLQNPTIVIDAIRRVVRR